MLVKRISERPQVPALPPPAGMSQIGTGAPPATSTRFSLSLVKKASDRPSGDQRIEFAPSVPAMGLASGADSGRSQTRAAASFALDATYASVAPSGETARKLPSTT